MIDSAESPGHPAEGRPVGVMTVIGAQARRVWRRGGVRRGVTVTLGILLALSIGTAFTLRYLSGGDEYGADLLILLPVQLCGGTAVLFLPLILGIQAARDGQFGLVYITWAVFPRRSSFLLGRLLADAGVAAGSVAVASLVALAASIVVTGTFTVPPLALLAVLTAAVGSACLTVLAVSLGLALRRVTTTALGYVGTLVVLPLVLGVGIPLSPAPISGALSWIVTATPSALAIRMTSVTNASQIDGAAAAFVGSCAWAAAAGLVALLFVRRHSA